jgi:hypothetical protein
MNKFIFAAVIIAAVGSVSIARADDCGAFAGHWIGVVANDLPPMYTALDIGFVANTSALSLSYVGSTVNQGASFIENYVADGIEHQGDGRYTGDKYSAVCKSGQITIVRSFEEIIKPLDTTLTLNGNELDFYEVAETDNHPTVVHFVRQLSCGFDCR